MSTNCLAVKPNEVKYVVIDTLLVFCTTNDMVELMSGKVLF